MPTEFRIPIYKPDLSGNEKAYVNRAIDSTWISSKGEFLESFEGHFSKRISINYALAVSNGTVALHLAMLALGIGAGDEVIVPTLTYIAPINAVKYVGATPVFVDSERLTWQIDVSKIERAINNKTRAIIAVHLYGQSCEMLALKDLADRYGLFIIEDCAESFGTVLQGRHVGTFGDIGIFSFYGNKTITSGEGGMVVTHDKTLFERASRFRGQGLAAYREYWHDVIGYNFRMTNVAAAIGLAQLERADQIIAAKKRLARTYRELLRDLPLEFHDAPLERDHTHWMVSVLVEKNFMRDALRRHMAENRIETRPVFYPVHTMPMYSTNFQRFPVAEDIAWRGINLPSYPTISDQEIVAVTDTIRNFFRQDSNNCVRQEAD
jgi:perosamine synthetase